MDNINLLNLLNDSSKPFRMTTRVVAKKKITDFYGKTVDCVVYFKEFLNGNSPENIIPGYFVSEIMKSDSMNGKYYVFSIKETGLKKLNIRIKSDDELIKIFKPANLEIIESQCNNLFTDPLILGNVYYARSQVYGLIIFRVIDVFDNISCQGLLLKSSDNSKLGKKFNIYINKDKTFIIEY